MSANYKTGPYSFTTQVRWYGSAILNNAWNTGNLATAATRYTVSDSVFNVDPTAYLDLRASYDLNENSQFYAAVDNLLNIPPQMVPAYSGGIQSNGGPIHSVTQYDYLGREVRARHPLQLLGASSDFGGSGVERDADPVFVRLTHVDAMQKP